MNLIGKYNDESIDLSIKYTFTIILRTKGYAPELI